VELLLRLLRRFGRVEEAKEAERVRRAAGRPPLQAGQRMAWSGQAERMAATRQPSSIAGRHCDDSEV